MAQKLLFLFSSLIIGAFLPAQDTQAENLFNNAATFMAAGKHQDALKDYQAIVDNYPNSGWADKALLEIGHFYQHVEKNVEQALVYYTRIKEEHAQSESAPTAYYFSSEIREHLANNRTELDGAGNDLVRMIGLYPDSDKEADALYLMGKINARLGNFALAQSFLQQLLLYYPQSELIPKSFLLRARIAYYSGNKELAMEILARMQGHFPSDRSSYQASMEMGRLIERMLQDQISYSLDREFPASTPKTYRNPRLVQVTNNGTIAVVDNNGLHFLTRPGQEAPRVNVNARDIQDLALTPQGDLAIGLSDRIITLAEEGNAPSISVSELKSLAIDDFWRFYALEDRQKDTMLYDRKGAFLRKLGVEKSGMVRCRDQEVWILGPDDDSLIRFDANIKHIGTAASFDRVKDFCFDSLGNLYVIYNKGNNLAVLSREGERRANLDFKNGSFPLRQAASVAVDRSGSIYVVDSRGGAVYRFF